MKQIIIKKKRKKNGYKIKRKAGSIAALAAAICLLYTALPMQVWAQGASFDIFHQHTGNETEGGGCYQETIYHSHAGSESEGGECYQTPVYHIHSGNEEEGGSCYGTILYHTHLGSESSGGECYAATYHTHTGSCSVSAECEVEFVDVGSAITTKTMYCTHHEEVTHRVCPAKEKHSACGSREKSTTVTYCMYCGYYGYSHTYSKNVCGMGDGTVTGYQLACGKDDTTPEGYELDCSKDSDTIDSYSLSCGKDEQTIEGYRINCGWDDDQPVAKLVILNETKESKEKVILSVKVEDLTEGKLNFTDGFFVWYDSAGNVISEDSRVEVSDNGEYRVEFVPQDEQQLNGLNGKIQVNNVYKPTPKPVPENEKKPEESDDDRVTEGGEEEAEDDSAYKEEEVQPTVIPTSAPIVSPSATPTPTAGLLSKSDQLLPAEQNVSYGEQEDLDNLMKNKPTATPSVTPVPTVTPSPSPVVLPTAMPETEDISGDNIGNEVLGEERKEEDFSRWLRKLTDFFAKPAVKVFTITTGTTLTICLLGMWAAFLYKTVKVYNDDGTGQMTCLGRCMVVREKDDFCITISDAMVERSTTNRYAIRPGLFLIGKAEDQELFVCKGKKRIAVYLNKEMIVVI